MRTMGVISTLLINVNGKWVTRHAWGDAEMDMRSEKSEREKLQERWMHDDEDEC